MYSGDKWRGGGERTQSTLLLREILRMLTSYDDNNSKGDFFVFRTKNLIKIKNNKTY